MQGLVSVDMSDNELTDDGVLALLPTLRDDVWLLALYLQRNRLTTRSMVPFLHAMAHNTSLLHYSLLPSIALESSDPSLAALASVLDPHAEYRQQRMREMQAKGVWMQPHLLIQDTAAARPVSARAYRGRRLRLLMRTRGC